MEPDFPALALVDVDGTLIPVSSEKLFLLHLLRRGIVGFPRLTAFGLQYLVHPLRTMAQGRGWNRRYLRGLPESGVMREALDYSRRELVPRIRGQVADMVRNLSGGGCRVILLSASLVYLVEPLARELGVDGVRASVPEKEGEILTGGLSGLRPWGSDKAMVCFRICSREGVSPSRVLAVGDSWSDRFLMESCGMAIAVSPDRRLRRLAEARGWKILEGRHTAWA